MRFRILFTQRKTARLSGNTCLVATSSSRELGRSQKKDLGATTNTVHLGDVCKILCSYKKEAMRGWWLWETSLTTLDWASTVGWMGANGDEICFCCTYATHHPALSTIARVMLFLSGMPLGSAAGSRTCTLVHADFA